MSEPQYETQDLGHLGIVAGFCHYIGLSGLIDAFIGPVEPVPRKVSVGQAVVAMVLNALGFTSRALYLTPEFYRNKPVEVLIGEGLVADDLNEDSLGRALDHLYEAGLTELFAHLASHVLIQIGLVADHLHLDTSTFSFQGDFDSQDPTAAVALTYGHSKELRPDLKQLVVSIICEHQAGLPLYFEALSGNSNDSSSFRDTIAAFTHQLASSQQPYCWIADSKFYSAETLAALPAQARFVTRVPHTLKEARQLILDTEPDELALCSSDPRYRCAEVTSNYAGVEQRWAIFYSAPRAEAKRKKLDEKVTQEYKTLQKSLKGLAKQRFKDRSVARCELAALEASWSYHKVGALDWHEELGYERAGKPRKGEPKRSFWRLQASAVVDEQTVQQAARGQGLFILATNVLDTGELSTEGMLSLYKSQNTTVERGFRFLKDPMFFAHGLYLKKPERIMAMLMVMTLALLVYALAEYHLRSQLTAQQQTLPDQKGKPTQRITMRRVFQMFEGIHVLLIQSDGQTQRRLLNIRQVHRQILALLPAQVVILYEPPG